MSVQRDIVLICGGLYHDIDFARLELLKLLAEHDHFRVQVRADYADVDAIANADGLITYTCEVVPETHQVQALRQYLARGKHWFALHGTNSKLKYVKGSGWVAPHDDTGFMKLLGSQFVAHPPIQPFEVRASESHPLVDGIERFEADDEIYLCRFFGDHQCLLETEFSGTAEGFAESDWQDNGKVPLMYLRDAAGGTVLYLNLGHARGHYDMRPLMDYYETVERGSWKQAAFYQLLRRGIRWMVNEPLEQAA